MPLCKSYYIIPFSFYKVWDATAADPKFSVFLKSYRNIVHEPETLMSKEKVFGG